MEDCVFTILIVEDDEDLQEIYREELTRENRSILQAFSAEEAISILNETKPDAIILDIGLPKMSGIELLKKISRHKGRPDVPVLIVLGCDELSTRISGYVSGASRYFIKPVDMHSLASCIDAFEKRNPHCGKAALN